VHVAALAVTAIAAAALAATAHAAASRALAGLSPSFLSFLFSPSFQPPQQAKGEHFNPDKT